MDDEQKQLKAVDLLVESLKLYVTLSTIAIAGLLAYYSAGKATGHLYFFLFSILALVVCSIASIWNVNHLISEVSDGNTNIYNGQSEIINWIAILGFVIGIALGGLFLYLNRPTTSVPAPSAGNIVTIQGQSVTVGQDIKTKVRITKDAKGNITGVDVN